MRMRRKAWPALAAACALGLPLPAQNLEQRIAAWLEQPAAARASWAIAAVRLPDGAVLYQRNARVPMTPASNTKLATTALALFRLGPGYRFVTRVLAAGRPGPDGLLRGDLRLVGGGDPTLSGRPVPYEKDAKEGDPLGPLAALADQVAARGVTRIDGDIVGDATRWPWSPYPAGWAVGDMTWEYGAPVSALTINDNAVRLSVRPPKVEGEPATVEFTPPVEPFTVHNTLRTRRGAERRIEVTRAPGSRVLEIRGLAPPGGGAAVQWVAVPEPAQFAAEVFAMLLRKRGIVIRGRAVGLVRPPGVEWREPQGVELARRESPPLVELVKIVNKVSQNLHAEMLLRETAHVVRGEGTARAGVEEARALLQEAGAAEEEFDLEDGSGLSRRGLLSAWTLAALLRHIEAKGMGDLFRQTLPIAGSDGTLSGRFQGVAEAGGIRAKTGSLAHVAALSGYAEGGAGRRVAFSILVNGYTAPAADVRALMDKIAIEILKESGQ